MNREPARSRAVCKKSQHAFQRLIDGISGGAKSAYRMPMVASAEGAKQQNDGQHEDERR